MDTHCGRLLICLKTLDRALEGASDMGESKYIVIFLKESRGLFIDQRRSFIDSHATVNTIKLSQKKSSQAISTHLINTIFSIIKCR